MNDLVSIKESHHNIVMTFVKEDLSHWYEAESALTKVFQKQVDIEFSRNNQIHGYSYSLADLTDRILAVSQQLPVLAEVTEKDLPCIPESWLNTLLSQLNAFSSAIDTFQDLTDEFQVLQEQNHPATYDPDLLKITFTVANSTRSFDFRSQIAKVQAHLVSIQEQLLLISFIIKPDEFKAYSKRTHNLKILVDEIRETEADFFQKKATVETYLESIATNAEAIESIKNQAGTSWEQIQEQASLIDQQATSSAQLLETHQETAESISEIAEAIDNDRSSIADMHINIQEIDKTANEFSGKASSHEEKINEHFVSLKKLEEEHSIINEDISNINKVALDMLSTANNAGLASAYAERIEEADKRLGIISTQFVKAIVALSVSSLPLLIYALGPLISSLFGSESGAAIQPAAQAEIGSTSFSASSKDSPETTSSFDGNRWASALTLSLIMIPAAWYAKFRATEYSTLFKLRELYAHKYSLAKSVDGFKKQAPEYADEIAATTYGQLTENPTKHLDVKEMEKHPSPLVEVLLQKLSKNRQARENTE